MNKIKTILKQNRFVYLIYNYVFSFILNVIGLFVKTDEKLVLFNSFGGKRFDDSPKAIYDYMKKTHILQVHFLIPHFSPLTCRFPFIFL